jgi:hypothetical protein
MMGFKQMGNGDYYYFPKHHLEPIFLVKCGNGSSGYVNLNKLCLIIPSTLIGKRVKIKLEIVRYDENVNNI